MASTCCLGLLLHVEVLSSINLVLEIFLFMPSLIMNFVWLNGSAKRLGPLMKVVLCVLFTPVLVLWPIGAVLGSFLGGLAYGFLGPMFGTFKAVGEGKTDQFVHCITVSKTTIS